MRGRGGLRGGVVRGRGGEGRGDEGARWQEELGV